jgi:hypothetical protein
MHFSLKRLEDFLNYCEYDPSQLPPLMSHAVALSSVAFYEFDCAFMFDLKRS